MHTHTNTQTHTHTHIYIYIYIKKLVFFFRLYIANNAYNCISNYKGRDHLNRVTYMSQPQRIEINLHPKYKFNLLRNLEIV